jgi:hypothetical protein
MDMMEGEWTRKIEKYSKHEVFQIASTVVIILNLYKKIQVHIS